MDKLIMNITDYKLFNQINIKINKLNIVNGVNECDKSRVCGISFSIVDLIYFLMKILKNEKVYGFKQFMNKVIS